MRWLHSLALAALAADVALQVVRKDVTGTVAAFVVAAVARRRVRRSLCPA